MIIFLFFFKYSFILFRFNDGTEKYISESGEEKTYFDDGTMQIIDVNRIKTIKYCDGREVNDSIFFIF
jgi:hypothetical protein